MKTDAEYTHYDSLFGCIGLDNNLGSCYFLILLVQLFMLLIMPFIVYYKVQKYLKKKIFKKILREIFSDTPEELMIVSCVLVGIPIFLISLVATAVMCVPVLIW